MHTQDIEYNTEREQLVIPEYGRHIQKMVNHAIAIEDKEERNKVAKAIIGVMGNMQPHLRDVPDFQHKLWDQLFIISKFKLDVDAPYPVLTEEELKQRPDPLEYPAHEMRYRHYGHIVQVLIKKAIEMEDLEMKKEFTHVIAAYMKLAFRTWNHEANINDNVIKADLKEISDGELEMDPEEAISYLATSYVKPKKQTNHKGHRSGKKKKSNHKKRRK